MDQNLNMKVKILNLLEENKGENLSDSRVDRDSLDRTWKAQTVEEK